MGERYEVHWGCSVARARPRPPVHIGSARPAPANERAAGGWERGKGERKAGRPVRSFVTFLKLNLKFEMNIGRSCIPASWRPGVGVAGAERVGRGSRKEEASRPDSAASIARMLRPAAPRYRRAGRGAGLHRVIPYRVVLPRNLRQLFVFQPAILIRFPSQ